MDDIVLSYSHTVTRELVHRAATAEVFLTDHTADPSGGYLLAAQLPRTHSYFNDHTVSPPIYDPLLLMEVFRQSGILVWHTYLDAPSGSCFIFDSGDLTILDMAALRIGAEPGKVRIHYTVPEVKRRGDRITGAVFEVRASIDGHDAATGRLVSRWVPRTTWDALRTRARAALDLTPRAHPEGQRLPAYLVGRHSTQNVVLAEACQSGGVVTGKVVVDTSHPALFDHPLDHVPGAMMFEAFRQIALFAATELYGFSPRSLTVTNLRTEFQRVGELELPTDCRATVREITADGSVALDVAICQEGCVIATARVDLARVNSPLSAETTPSEVFTSAA